MHLSLICPVLDLVFAGLAIYAMNKLVLERARLDEANKTIVVLNSTIDSLHARVQDERSGVAELFLNQPLAMDEFATAAR